MHQPRILGRQGYTMIETVTTLVVAGILTAVGVVFLAPAVEHGKVRSAANVVAGDLQFAQNLAVRERRPIAVLVDSAAKKIVIRDRDLVTKVYRTRLLGPGTAFSLDELTATSGSVQLFPNGVAGSTITVTLGLRGFARQVRLSRAGQIRIIRVP
jgi:prepilin-type N-terminal cleavage/methylation domain-containing protein